MKSVMQNEKMKLIDKKEVKHKTSRKKKIPFSKYENAVNCTDIVEWIKDQISKSKNERIKVRIIDLIKELDIKSQDITYTAIYTALDYVFFKRDILVNLSTANNGDKLLIFRPKKDTDIAPFWIENLLKKEIDVEKLEEDHVINRNVQLQVVEDEEEDKNKDKKNLEIISKTKDKSKKQKMLKEELKEGNLDEADEVDYPFKVDILVFDFNKLGWKIKQSKTVYTNFQLLELIKQGISKAKDRKRIEITAITRKDKKDDTYNREIEIERKNADVETGGLEIERKDADVETGGLEIERKEADVETGGLKNEVEREIEEKENTQPQEVEDKLSQLLPQKRDDEQKAAIKYLIQRYRKSYPNEKNK